MRYREYSFLPFYSFTFIPFHPFYFFTFPLFHPFKLPLQFRYM